MVKNKLLSVIPLMIPLVRLILALVSVNAHAKCNLASPSRLFINSSKAINSFLTSRDISSSSSSLSKGLERDDEDTSVSLAIRQVTFLVGEFSFGESKGENVGVEVVARAATP